MASTSLALQWSLDKTVDNTLSIAKSLIQIATNDNIQAVVFLACPKLGAQLAISPAARQQISTIAKENIDPVSIRCLKATVNYSQNDSLSLLSSSLGGQNFLVLASMLISTMSNFDASVVMENIITASASDRSLLPGSDHLKDLFDILEPKLNRAGFLNAVLNCKQQWSNNKHVSDNGRLVLERAGDSFPDAKGIHQLLAAFATVARIGDSDAKRVNITARVCVPWLTAFATWSIGVPPARHTTAGKVISEEPESPVTIIFADDEQFNNLDVTIEIVSSGRSFPEVLPAKAADPRMFLGAVGMVNVGVYARHMLQRQKLMTGIGQRALKHALPLALKQVRDLCFFEGVPVELSNRSEWRSLLGNPFPPEDVISETAAKYLKPVTDARRCIPAISRPYLPSEEEQYLLAEPGSHSPSTMEHYVPTNLEEYALKTLEPSMLVSDERVVKTWQEQNPNETFVKAISPIVADILALSLFETCLDVVQVYYCRNRTMGNPSMRVWENKVQQILDTGKPQKCEIVSILAFTLGLLRHEVSLKEWKWVASSFHGQVVFPRIFEDQILQRDGYLGLYCFPGILVPDEPRKKPIKLVRPQTQHLVESRDDVLLNEITSAVNLYEDWELLWHISSREDCIQIGMGWTKSQAVLDPFSTLQSLAYALFATCSHNSDAPRDNPLAGCHCRSPVDDRLRQRENATEFNITIFPVTDSPGLRMLALSSIVWRLGSIRNNNPLVVINQGACFNCLVSYCDRFACQCLIL